MNASTYLHNQGWRGEGFSLDHTNRGLAKPLLVSHKSDLAGLGTKKNDFGNQWWTDAFDKSLKAFGSPKQSGPPATQKRGLYAGFVKAETLTSTITDKNLQPSSDRKEVTMDSTMPTSVVSVPMESTRHFGVLGLPPSSAPAFDPVEEKRERKNKKRKADEISVPSIEALDPKSVEEKRERKKKKRNTDDNFIPLSEALDSKAVEEKQEKKKKNRPFQNIRDPDTGVIKRPPDMPKQEFMRRVKKAKKVERKERVAKELKEKRLKAKQKDRSLVSNQSVVTDAADQGRAEPAADAQTKQEPAKEDAVKKQAEHIGRSEPVPKSGRPKKRERKEKAGELRAQRKSEKAETARKNAIRQKEAAVAKLTSDEPLDPTRELRRPLHPESIMALREQGRHVTLPGDQGDEDYFMFQLIKCYETGMVARAKHILISAVRSTDTTEEVTKEQTKDNAAAPKGKPKRDLAKKYERETRKRKLNRDAKQWVMVRASPYLYRPDGTLIPPLSRGVSQDEVNAVREAAKAERRRIAAKKQAVIDQKAQVKADKAAEKIRRRKERQAAELEKQQEKPGES